VLHEVISAAGMVGRSSHAPWIVITGSDIPTGVAVFGSAVWAHTPKTNKMQITIPATHGLLIIADVVNDMADHPVVVLAS